MGTLTLLRYLSQFSIRVLSFGVLETRESNHLGAQGTFERFYIQEKTGLKLINICRDGGKHLHNKALQIKAELSTPVHMETGPHDPHTVFGVFFLRQNT